MKIVVVGYGEMFDSLIAGIYNSRHEIVGVFRHENILYHPLKRFLYDLLMPTGNRIFTKSLGLYDIKAPSVNSDKFRKIIKKLKADVIIVGSWSEKFSTETINTPETACINVHPSLLPSYRGPNPYLQVILNGETKSGVTFHIMDENYDTGPILYREQTEITDYETGLSLKLKCCGIARKSVEKVIDSFNGNIQMPLKQNDEESSYQKQISLKDSILNFEKETSLEIDRRIRAFTPWLNCHIAYNDEFFQFGKYKLIDEKVKEQPGTIIKKTSDSLCIVCADSKPAEFSLLKLKRPFCGLFTGLYLKYIVKINSKVH